MHEEKCQLICSSERGAWLGLCFGVWWRYLGRLLELNDASKENCCLQHGQMPVR